MDVLHETIQVDDGSPVRMFLHSVEYIPPHWHDGLELLLALDGEIFLRLNEQNITIIAGDLVVINRDDVHALTGKRGNLALALQIPYSFLSEYIQNKRFDYQNADSEGSMQVKRLMARLVMLRERKDPHYKVRSLELLYELAYTMLSRFSVSTEPAGVSATRKHLKRLSAITRYIEKNYQNDISLRDVAQHHGLTPNYFASFFQKYMTKTFLNYLNDVRLSHAYKTLMETDLTVTDVALENGFPNVKAFNRIFRESFGDSPGAFRKTGAMSERNKAQMLGYFNVGTENSLETLRPYLEETKKTRIAIPDSRPIKIDAQIKGTKLKHTWRTLLTFGSAAEGLLNEVQSHIRTIQSSVGFRYARFHGLLDDEMFVCGEENGRIRYSFSRVFELCDFLISIGLKPMAELSFMPQALASGSQTLFHRQSNISPPKDTVLWTELVVALMKSLTARYGVEEISGWRFEFWNEPDMPQIMWAGSEEEYLDFWRDTYIAVKKACPHVVLGGPACILCTISDEWFRRYIDFCRENGCTPDFITAHFYPLDFISFIGSGNVDFDEDPKIMDDPNALKKALSEAKETLAKMGLGALELHITEWNSTAWHRDLVSDTCYKSAYIAKNIAETLDMADSLGFWTVSDYMSELFPPDEMFHGGLGLITYNGVRKAGLHAFSLLSRLGGILIGAGDGWIATRFGEGNAANICILLYNYCHYNRHYRKFDASCVTRTSRDSVYENMSRLQWNILLEGLDAGTYVIRETHISPEEGSAYDQWLRMGAPITLSHEDAETLDSRSVPLPRLLIAETEPVSANKSVLSHAIELCPLEIVLLEIRKD